MLSRFDEARAKPTFNASPSITSAVLPKPSLPSCCLSVLVLPSATSRLSMTRRLPSLAFVGVGSRLGAVLGRAGFFIIFSLGRVGGFGVRCLSGLCSGRSAGFLLSSDRSDFLVARQRRHLVHRCVVDQASLWDVDVA